MSWFCNKLGTACKFKTEDEQSIHCEHWDPVNFLCNDKCRHCQNVDNLELARHQWAQRQRLNAPKNKRTETPERPMLINKDGEILVKETLAKERIEMMRRQAAAAEKMAEVSQHMATVIEDIGSIILENLGRIAEKLEPIARMFGDDEEGDDE